MMFMYGMADLTEAKSIIRQRISELESMLEAERVRLQHIEAAEAIVASLEQPASQLDYPSNQAATVERRGKTGLTKCALEVVHRFGKTRALTPAAIREYMIKVGFEPTSKSFAVTVNTALIRLAKRGLIAAENTDQGRLYRAVEEAY